MFSNRYLEMHKLQPDPETSDIAKAEKWADKWKFFKHGQHIVLIT